MGSRPLGLILSKTIRGKQPRRKMRRLHRAGTVERRALLKNLVVATQHRQRALVGSPAPSYATCAARREAARTTGAPSRTPPYLPRSEASLSAPPHAADPQRLGRVLPLPNHTKGLANQCVQTRTSAAENVRARVAEAPAPKIVAFSEQPLDASSAIKVASSTQPSRPRSQVLRPYKKKRQQGC